MSDYNTDDNGNIIITDNDDPYGFSKITPTEVSTKPNFEYEPSQADPELQNVMSFSPFDGTVSGSRKQMTGASHIPQSLVVTGSTPRRIQTGAEQKYGKATFMVSAEQDCEILQRFSLYDYQQLGEDAIKHSPETTLIVENYGTHDNPNAREIHCITLPEYFTAHQYFGFQYQRQEGVKNLRPGTALKAGTILLDSPNKHQDGNYCIGRELNCVFASFDAVAEDGVILSEEALPWLRTMRYERRTISFGASHYLANIYGKDGKYKGLPEIGDYIRPDGLLACARSYDSDFSLIEMSGRSLKRVNYTHDKLTYVQPGIGRVIDVRVEHDRSSSVTSPVICNEQILRYDEARRAYYQQIWDYYNNVLRKRYAHSGGVPMSDEFNQLIKKAHSIVRERKDHTKRNGENEKVQKIYRGSPSDDFTVEIVVEYINQPKVGSKITDLWGGKGVVVKILPKEDMPVDEQGNRAHIIMDDIATISRMNLGRLYEQYINASSRDYTKKLCAILGLPEPEINGPRYGGRKLNASQRMQVASQVQTNPALMEWWEGFKDLIGTVNPVLQKEFYEKQVDPHPALVAEHICSIVDDGIYHYHPTNADPELPPMLKKIREKYPAHKSPITFRGNLGEMVTSKNPILIGSMYFVLLEKTGDDWNAVSSGRLQSYGILSQINNQDKYASPWRQQAIRAWGETETAIGISYFGWKTMAIIINRNNNIDTHRKNVLSVISAENPTNIEYLAGSPEDGLDGAKPLQLVNHMAMCNGWKFTYKSYEETNPKPESIVFKI